MLNNIMKEKKRNKGNFFYLVILVDSFVQIGIGIVTAGEMKGLYSFSIRGTYVTIFICY